MVRLLLFFVLGLTSFPILAQHTKQFDYQITPVIEGDQSHFIVSIDFKTNQKGESRFLFPHVWGIGSPDESIKILQVKNATYKEDSTGLTVSYRKNAKVRITYRLNNSVTDSIPGRGQEYLPTIKPTYFTLFSNSGLIVLEDTTKSHFDFTINWKNYPKQYKLQPVTSFGKGLSQQLRSATVEDVQNAIFVGGDYRLYEFINAHDQITTFAIRGKWNFDDQELDEVIKSTLEQQRKFWDDYSTKNYLITVSAGGYENEFEQSYTGTGLNNSFAVTAVCNSTTQPESLYYLFHHELMHHWIGHSIKNAADEELSYWFSEGFTDYFSRKNMYESGLIDKAAYLKIIDSVLAIHYTSPVMAAHNDSIKVHFWDDHRTYGKLPYNRGSIFAYYLDGKIQTLSKGKYDLKTVMRSMLSQTKAEKKQFHWTWLQQEILALINYDISFDYNQYIIAGEPLPINELNRNLNNSLELRTVKVFAQGFTFEKDPESGKTLVTSITKGSGAEGSGLQIGDVVKGYSLYGSVYTESEVTVQRGEELINLPFYAYILSEPIPQHVSR